MSYRINYTDTVNNPNGIVVNDQSLNNTDTDLVFVGKNYPGYAQFIGENFLHLLENFARNTPPAKPIIGQLWYDTGTLSTPVKPQLKVFDGTMWTEAGNVKKSTVRPSIQTSIIGDLWVDTTNQQLYLFTGNSWSLVGPQFSEKNLSGVKIEEILDRNDTLKTVISLVVDDDRIAVVSKDEFIPKQVLSGFPTIKQGLTLSTIEAKKYWGISEKAEALVVGNNTVAAGNFLRSDVASTTNFGLNVRSSAGINLGPSLETSIISVTSGTLIKQSNPDASITLQTTDVGGTINDVLVVSGNKQIGINKIPETALDVNGNIQTNGTLKVINAVQNSLETTGGIVVGGNLSVAGNNVAILGELEIGTTGVSKPILYPKTDRQLDLGRVDRKFKTVYAETISANITGNLDGNITGSAATANALTTPREFSIVGDMESTVSEIFNGENNVAITVAVGDSIIANRTEANASPLNDYLLVYNSLGTPPLRKIQKSTFLAGFGSVPVGAIVPYAGLAPPPGWLFCDGSEQSRAIYSSLFSVIGLTYRPQSSLTGFNTFAVPDLRGRFALGRENMDNNNTVSIQTIASGVTRQQVFPGAITATFIVPNTTTINGPFQVGRTLTGTGLDTSLSPVVISSVTNNTPTLGQTTMVVSCGVQSALASTSNLQIESTGVIDAGGNTPTPSRVPAATSLNITGGQSTQVSTLVGTEGGFTQTVGNAIDIMNPFLTVNYIIYAGV